MEGPFQEAPMDLYVVALLHFNLQYVAGGMEGTFEDWPCDEISIEDQIIEESFEPILDLMAQHPDWAIDIELQGYMVEVLAERHPLVLDKLHALAHGGQVELVSWHYSAQLWTAYPWLDQQRSIELTQSIFAQHDLPLSGVVFSQEGQFSQGQLERMPEYGYDVACLPHNLGELFWGADPDESLFRYRDVRVIPTRGVTGLDGSYQVHWSFMDDGELLATDDSNPYMGPYFLHDPAAVEAWANRIESYVDIGAHIVSIGDYVEAIADRASVPLPPVLDGTWQPADTGNLELWMGGPGLWSATEDDNLVLTGNVQARQAVAATELAVAGDPQAEALVEQAWREALLGQVSDATGWNPYHTEVSYAFEHAGNAVALAEEALALACETQQASGVRVDLHQGEVHWDPEPIAEPIPGQILVEPTLCGRAGELDWLDSEQGQRLVIEFPAADEAPCVAFPWDARVYATIPALMVDELVEVDALLYGEEGMGLPLPSGLVRLEEGLWLVKDTRTVHLAAVFEHSEGRIVFEDRTANEDDDLRWEFLVLEGDEEAAIELARRTNLEPTVELDCPPLDEEPDDGEGCGCSGSGAASTASLGLLALLGIALRRRSSEESSER
jgi:MYXO-CTERM domain-containing protein